MKTMQVSKLFKNLQLQHKLHHKMEHRQIPNLSDFYLELNEQTIPRIKVIS